MRRLLTIVLVLLVGLWLVPEVVAPPYAESCMEDEVRARSRGVAGVTADLATFPVVARQVETGEVPRLSVALDEVVGQQLTITRSASTYAASSSTVARCSAATYGCATSSKAS